MRFLPLRFAVLVLHALDEELIIQDVDRGELAEKVQAIIHEELSVEDRINDEVREILKDYENDIDQGRMDYRKLFDLTKHKIVKDRGVII